MIGYSMMPAWRGRGHATRAVRLLAAWAFEHAGIARLVAGTAPWNTASQRVLERAGFQREGYERSRLPGPRAPASTTSSSPCCRWQSTLRRGAGGQRDHAVVVALAPVDHARPAGVLVVEQVEVVPDELHLEQRVVDRHRVARVFLLPDDVPGLVVLDSTPARARRAPDAPALAASKAPFERGQRRRRGGHRDRGVPPAVDAAPVGGPAQPRVQLVDRLVQGAVEVSRARLGADHRTAGDTGDLDSLAVVGLTGVALVEQLDARPRSASGRSARPSASFSATCTR